MVLAATLNGEPKTEPAFFVKRADATLLIDEATLIRWRVLYPMTERIVLDGQAYVPVAAVAGMKVEVNEAQQTATVTLPAQSFQSESVPFEMAPQPAPITPGWGGFLNYNLFAQNAGSTTTAAGIFEPVVFGPYGVGSTLIGANSANSVGTTHKVVRFDTTWRADNPENLATLVLGDSITSVGSWGQAVRFGGIQYGTNFSLQPRFISYPLQAASGSTALPSTVDIFINNARVGEQQVQPGPFTITNIPIVSGAGNLQLVVKDAFGREQVISQPFYASQTLLKQGLADYAAEAGILRRDFGNVSNEYGGWVASGQYRYGMTDRLTGEVRAEAAEGLAAAGVHADFQVGDLAIASAGVVGSHSDTGQGRKLLAGFQRETAPWAFAVTAEWNSPRFREVGTLDQPLQLERQIALNASLDIAPFGTIGAAFASQRYREMPATSVGSATYSIPLGKFAFLNLSVTRVISTPSQTGVFATVTIPIGNDSFAAIGAQRTRGSAGQSGSESVTYQKNLPAGDGYGYRLFAESDRRYEAFATLNTPTGTYSAGAAQAGSTTAVQLNATGGVGLVGGYPFASRQLLGSFAMARTGGIEGVQILSENQPIGRTNRDGFVVIPDLRPYDENPITLDPLSVPLNATIGSAKMIAIPYVRSGVLIDFPIKRQYVGTLTIMLEDGKPAPEGAVVMLAGDDATFPVGFGGEAYVVGLRAGENDIRLRWRGSSCEFRIRTSTSSDPVPDLGSHVCRGVSR
jgi:outer membrane usher protein